MVQECLHVHTHIRVCILCSIEVDYDGFTQVVTQMQCSTDAEHVTEQLNLKSGIY